MKHIYLCALLLISTFSIAQTTITGTVTSAKMVTTLPYVNIYSNNNGTTTDNDGQYSITILDDTETVTFSFIGYKTQQLAVTIKPL